MDALPFSAEDLDPKSQAFLADYAVGDLLGLGAFSEVHMAENRRTGQQVALKIVDKAASQAEAVDIAQEVRILSQIRHPNVVALYDAYEGETKIFLVMELVSGGELFDQIVERGQYTEEDAAAIVRDVVDATAYLHRHNIVHRDLKPENLLLSDVTENARVMISDFGLSKITAPDQVMKTACGTLGYAAPEVLARNGYNAEVDAWSIGVIAYVLLCGYPPFYGAKDADLFDAILVGHYDFPSPDWDYISDEGLHLRWAAKNFITRMLMVNPAERMSCEEALRDPWLAASEPNVDAANLATGRALRRFGSRQTLSGPNETFEDEQPWYDDKSTSTISSNGSDPTSPARSLPVGVAQGKMVRVLSYNMCLRPPHVKSSASDFKDARLTRFIAEHLGSYDILGLQEVYDYGSTRQQRLIDAAARAGLNYHLSTPSKSFLQGKIDGGVLLLSRFPIVASDVYKFNRGLHADRLTAKGILYGKIQVAPRRHVHVFVTHLQSSFLGEDGVPDPKCRTVRRQQLLQLFEFISAKTHGTRRQEPILVLGDMQVDGRKSEGVSSDSAEYTSMINILRGGESGKMVLAAEDVLRDQTREQPNMITPIHEGVDADGRDGLKPKGALPSYRPEYVFWVPATVSSGVPPIVLGPGSVAVEPFDVTGDKFQHLSNTAGISLGLFVPNLKQRAVDVS